MSEPGDEGQWQLPDERTTAEPEPVPPGPPPGGAGRVVCRVAVAFAVLGLPAIATPFVALPIELAVLPGLAFVLGWLGVWLVDRAQGTGRNTGLVAVRIGAVCLLVALLPPLFEWLLL